MQAVISCVNLELVSSYYLRNMFMSSVTSCFNLVLSDASCYQLGQAGIGCVKLLI